MNTIQSKCTKEEHLNYVSKRIQMRNELMNFYISSYLPTLMKFDGKVYNIRFIKALREEAAANPLIYITEKDGDCIEIHCRSTKFSYTDYECLYAKCITNDDNRLSYQLTINDEAGIKWIENFKETTKEHEYTIKHYDEYMEIANKLVKTLNEYNKLPNVFRRNLYTEWLRVY